MSLDSILAGAAEIRQGKHKPSGQPAVVPLAGFYRRDDDTERQRCRMYHDLALIFEFEGWRIRRPEMPQKIEPGRDSRGAALAHYGDSRRATFRDNNSHPLEWLEGNMKLLRDPVAGRETEQQMMAAHDSGVRRARIARDYHETKIGGEASGLKSVDLERVSGAGFGPGSISDHQITCMQKVSEWESTMPTAVRRTMQVVLYEGRFSFLPLGTPDSDLVLRQIRLGLDIIAECNGDLPRSEFLSLWPSMKQARKYRPVDAGWADR